MKATKLADCFEENGRTFLNLTQGKLPEVKLTVEIKTAISKVKVWKLVHANMLYKKDNQPFSHCWIEGDDFFTFDFTTGAHPDLLATYKEDYYKLGKIPYEDFKEDWKGLEDQAHLFKYNIKDAIAVFKRNMSWGPWDFKFKER